MSRHDLKVFANIKAEVPLCVKTFGVGPSAGPHILLKKTPDKVNQTPGRTGPERDRAVTVHNARPPAQKPHAPDQCLESSQDC